MPQTRQACKEMDWTSGSGSGSAESGSRSDYTDSGAEYDSDNNDCPSIDALATAATKNTTFKPVLFDASQPQDDNDIEEVEEQVRQFKEDNAPPSGECSDSDDEELFNGNRAPPEFYRQNIRDINVNDFKRKHYSKGTLKLISNCENYWISYAAPRVASEPG